jgi:hypothetical protein
VDIEERLNLLQKDFGEFKEDIKELLLDIRSYLMEAQNPLKAYEGKRGKSKSQNKPEKEITQDKGVTEDGN